MSRIFDFLQQTGTNAGTGMGLSSENGDVQQILSVLETPQTRSQMNELAVEPAAALCGPEQVEQVDIDPRVRLAFHADPGGLAADRYRLLRMRLNELWNTGKVRRLLITSACPKDGKSTVALNLATALGEYGKKSVVLVDGDLHRPSLSRMLGIEPREGLADCLVKGYDPLRAVRHLEPLGWSILSAGEVVGNPTELLVRESLAEVVRRLSTRYDWVLFDSPPVVGVTDTLLLTRHVDATMLVVRAGSTPGKAIEDAIERIGRKHVAGVVLNAIERLDHAYAKYQSYYYKGGRAKAASR